MIEMNGTAVYLTMASVFALLGTFTDLKTRRIPNWLTGSAFISGLVFHMVLDGWHGALSAALAGLIAGCMFLVFYLAGGMGAGDVKMIAGLGTIVSLPNLEYLLVFTALAGGVIGVFLALNRGRLKETVANVGALTSHHVRRGLTPHADLNIKNVGTLRLPYGVPIAIGTLLTLYLKEVVK